MILIGLCDDMAEDIEVLGRFIEKYMDRRKLSYKIFKFLSGRELLESEQKFDILVLDIVIEEGINGIIVGEKLQKRYEKTKIIYTTNFSGYCSQAINKVHAFAYLEKPVSEEVFLEQLDEALAAMEEEKVKKERITFEIIKINKEHRVDTLLEEFEIDDIYYFEYINRKICIKTVRGEFYFIGQMKNIADRMKAYKFECCHQSYLIHLKYIKKIQGYHLYMKNGDIIPVSQKKSADFRKKLNEYIQKSI